MLTTSPNTLITTYLHMTRRGQFSPSYSKYNDGVSIERMATVDLDYYRYLYRAVGDAWSWRDRLVMSDEELHGILSNPNNHVYVMYVSGVPAGYVELMRQGDSVEIAYFGLRREFHGRGLGKHLLSFGVDKAWELGASRVWLHTCNLDGPHALTNYRKRGFEVYDQVEEPMPSLYVN